MAYSEVPVDVVRNACEAYLENRNRHIAKVKEECIQVEMQPWKLFGITFKGKTREKAIESLKKDRWSEYRMIAIEGGYWAGKVRDILELCQVPGVTTVKLSAEDASILHKFFS